MFKRKKLQNLLDWKAKKNNKPLLLRGARQVGKTTLANELGNHYTQFISLNLERQSDAESFKNTDDVKKIFENIQLIKNKNYIKNDTLLFIDEIQEIPEAIALLRYFYEDLPELDVIAAGSLLEFAIGEVPSFPVGRVENLYLHPLSFEEYLMAMEEDIALKHYYQLPLSDIAYNRLLSLFNTYTTIGGMPEIVKTYKENNGQIKNLDPVYNSIWNNYKRDIEKYGNNSTERNILRHIIQTAPMERDRITFHGYGNSNYRSREVGEAFRKLDKAGLIRLIYPTSDTDIPMRLNYRRKPKIQFLDTGILNYAAGIQVDLINQNDMNRLFNGYITNHIVNQEIIANAERLEYLPPFWTRENANANAEVDIAYQHKNEVIPLEVKSGKKGRLRSLHEFMDRCQHTKSVRLLANQMNLEVAYTRSKKEFQLLNIPYFMSGRLDSILDHYYQ